MTIPVGGPKTISTVTGDGAVGVQIDGDSNSVIIFAGASKLILDQPHKRRGTGRPSNERQLLLTEWRATTLVGRDEDLAALRDWRESPSSVAVRCITGRAGSGKTRLAIEGCDEAEVDGWIAGFVSGDELRRFHASQNLAGWRWSTDTLVVVDDAAASVSIVKEWLSALARHRSKPDQSRLRILLLERHADAESDYGWWAELRRRDSLAQVGAGDVIGPEQPMSLPVITLVDDRRALLAEAMRLAATLLAKPPLAPPRPGENPEFDQRLEDDRLENEPLFLVMAGIVAIERGAPAALALSRIELAKEISGFERERLARLGSSRGLPLDGRLIAHLAACVTLQRGCDLANAGQLVAEEMAAMNMVSPVSSEELVELLVQGLPGPAGDTIDRVRPDLIGEAFAVNELFGSKARSNETRLAIVERARGRDEANTLETLVLAAQDLAAGAADHPAVRWLTEIAQNSTVLDQLIRIAVGLPFDTLALRELGVVVGQRIIDLLRKETAPQSELFLAATLNDFAIRLGDLGKRDEALAAAREAVDRYRSLEAMKPSAFTLYLAISLNNMANCLNDVGLMEEAMAAAQESVDIQRTLVAAEPELVEPGLAGALINLANRLSQLGRREEALTAAQEAVELYRALAERQPELFSHHLAMAVHNLSIRQSDQGELEAALATGREAVVMLRTLAAAQPDAYTPILASSLNNFGIWLANLGHHEEGLAAAEEAVSLYRPLAHARPEVFLPELAGALLNVSSHLVSLGQDELALVAIRESVEIHRTLASARPDIFAHDLAGSLTNLAICLSKADQTEEALAASHEAVDVYRIAAAARPEAFNAELASALGLLGVLRSEVEEHGLALASFEESVVLYRALAVSRPGAHSPSLARVLMNLAECLFKIDEVKAAVEAAQEAVELQRKLATDRPDAFSPSLGASLTTLAVILGKFGRDEAALVATEEAAAICRRLAVADPATFVPILAHTLGGLAFRLEAGGRLIEAIDASKEAIEELRPFFLTDPVQMAMPMANHVHLYVKLAEKADAEPDLQLLWPIFERFDELQGRNENAD